MKCTLDSCEFDRAPDDKYFCFLHRRIWRLTLQKNKQHESTAPDVTVQGWLKQYQEGVINETNK